MGASVVKKMLYGAVSVHLRSKEKPRKKIKKKRGKIGKKLVSRRLCLPGRAHALLDVLSKKKKKRGTSFDTCTMKTANGNTLLEKLPR